MINVDHIRKERKKANITQKALAESSNVSQSLIARIESGDVDPRLSTFKKILKGLEELKKEKRVLARDIMNSPVIHLKPEDNVNEAVARMEEHNISQMPVISEKIQKGSIAESTVISLLTSSKSPKEIGELKIGKIMASPFPTVPEKTEIYEIIDLIKSSNAVIVMDKSLISGIITKIDLLDIIR